MMRWRGPDLGDRRQMNLAWAGAVALLAAGVLLGAQAERGYRAQLVRQASVQADLLAASVTAALAFDDRPTIREYVDALRVNPRIANAAVYDLRGHAVVAYTREGSPPPPPKLGDLQIGYHDGIVTVTTPVAEQEARLGTIYVETAPEPWSAFLARHSALFLLTFMAFLLLGVLTRAASQLQRRAVELTEANARLTVEMRERARAEDALRQSQKMEALGQLTGGIAHDFNNLLQVVHGAFELIRRKPEDHAKVAAWADNGLQAAERGASLTRQLLAFSRAQKLELRPFVVADLVAEMRDLITRTLGGEIELEFRLEDRSVAVLSDRTQLELAVLNLAINARDAMPDGGKLTVTSRVTEIPEGHPVLAADTYVELRVSDTGAGMAAEIAERAFDPFFTTKGVGKGTGLGLSQVYGVARQAGGVAQIESQAGQGTTVILFLRRSSQPTPADAPARPERSSPILAAGSASVLVVDDDPEVRSLVRDTLDLLGYRVLTAEGGAEALELLDRTRPDLMLIDFAMPGMNGAETAGLARQKWAELPIVFASGYADTAQVEDALGGGAVILRKPFEMDELARTVADALRPETRSA